MSSDGMYLRRASGLTRQISSWDALIFASLAPGPIYAMLYIVWAPALYPGANMFWGTLALPLLIPIMGVYYLLSVSMPRSGGEYVYVSRIISPSWGLFANWALMIVGLSWTGELTSWAVTYGLGSTIYNAGVLNNDQSLISLGTNLGSVTYGPGVAIGAILMVLLFLIMWRGSKPAMRMFWVGMGFAVIALVAVTVASLISSQAVFQSRLLQLTGVNLQTQIIQAAQSTGWVPGSFELMATFMAGATYINLNTLGNTFTTNVAGEIKNPSRSQPLALFGSLLIMGVYWAIAYGVMWINPGGNFWNAISILVNSGTSPLPIFPVANQIVIYLTSNPELIYLASIGFFIATLASAAGLAFGPIRSMFAWSFDRVIPDSFAKVDRRGSPYAALILAAVIAFIFYFGYDYTTLFSYILFTITLWFTAWVVVGAAGLVFPYVRKDIFEKSPAVVKTKVGGVPVISIAGGLTVIVSLIIVYFTLVPSLTGLTSFYDLVGTVVGLGILPFVIYYIGKAYRRSKGVALEAQYKVIPPD